MKLSIHRHARNKGALAGIFLLFVVLLLASCSNDDKGNKNNEIGKKAENDTNSSENIETIFPYTVSDLVGRKITFETAPERIISVVPADMEIIYALGGEVVGRPQSVNDKIEPPEAESAADVGYPLGINYEKIAELQGDMFIGHTRLNIDDVPTLEALNLNVLLTQGDSLDEITSLIKMYGDLLNKQEKANELIAKIELEVSEILADKQDNPAKVLILFGTPEETMAALPQSLAGNLFEMAGAENISKDLPNLETYPTYAQLSLERILQSDPDAIYFMSHGDAELALEQFQAEMGMIPAWNSLKAVKNDNMFVLPHHLFGTNPGPRIVESLQFLKDSLNSLEY